MVGWGSIVDGWLVTVERRLVALVFAFASFLELGQETHLSANPGQV